MVKQTVTGGGKLSTVSTDEHSLHRSGWTHLLCSYSSVRALLWPLILRTFILFFNWKIILAVPVACGSSGGQRLIESLPH